MDAKRYQQIQDLFWAVEELPREDRDDFLARNAGDDQGLIDEVQSLLREHDPDAAQVEGRSARPVRLPGSTKIGLASMADDESGRLSVGSTDADETSATGAEYADRPDMRKTVPMERSTPKRERAGGQTPKARSRSKPGNAPTTKKGQKGSSRPDANQRTVSGAQRTHAAPRHPASRRRKRGRGQDSGGRSTQTLPTSVGPSQRRFTWLPLWIAIIVTGLVPIWIAAWMMGNNHIASQQVANEKLLASVLEQTRLRFESIIDHDQHRSERIARQASEGAILVDETNPYGDSSNAQTALDSFLAKQPPKARDDWTFVVWDQKFRVVAMSSTRDLRPEAMTARYAGLVARCLEHRPVFVGPSSHPHPGDETARDMIAEHGNGWMFPVTAPSDPSRVLGAVMITKMSLWPVVNEAFDQIADEAGADVYLVDRHGIMQTDSPMAERLRSRPGENRSGTAFRVAEFTGGETSSPATNRVSPLTVAAAAVSTNRGNVIHTLAYPSYHGSDVSGAWRWLPSYGLGVIAEVPVRQYASAFSPSLLWASLASLLVLGLASGVTWWHQETLSTIRDARQPLGRYEIDRELGSGGMGVVYRARHKELGRDIALKVLRGDRQDEDDRQRFDREARLAASLSCPHSVTVFDFGYTEDDAAFCVMELLHGLTLAEIVARGGAQSPGRVVWIMQQICQSMLEAHGKGLMHRDLKPQNVMLRFDSVVGDWATVFDFGLAKPIEPDQDVFQTAETIWAGTPMYMAPERFRDPSSMDPRSDIYSIGCIAYYLLAGNPPFAECDPESMFALIMSEHPIGISTHRDEAIDPRLDRWVSDCMRKDKGSRAESIPELIRELQRLSNDMPWTRSDAEQWWSTHAKEMIERS
ncbi:MAG: protein kinase [Rhodopirellula sp. JB044]|uniref:protein kinase domain-containing protein n=1 Tax=Rhodopirellula sp. JB044 TaxID=3342844 RepID=UPI00370C0D3B